MTFKIIPILIFLVFLTSCSNVKLKVKPTKTYSKETNKSFEEIERANAIERYRQLRLESWEAPRNSHTNKTRRVAPKRYSRPTPPETVKPKAPTKILVEPSEQKIEVDQNLKFYCMKKRNDSRFSTDLSCENFTKTVLEQCEEDYEWDDKSLIKCVKGKLN